MTTPRPAFRGVNPWLTLLLVVIAALFAFPML